MRPLARCAVLLFAGGAALLPAADAAPSARAQRFAAASLDEGVRWQRSARQRLFELMMGGGRPAAVPLAPEIVGRTPVVAGGYTLEEVTLQSLPDRRVHAWLARPGRPRGPVGAVLALHGHGGTGEEVVRGLGPYWYGRALAEMGYVVIAPDIGSHDLQHAEWTLMGERVWDAVRCLDYLQSLPEVDHDRVVAAGLSLGGETTMYVAALDERVKAACSSGWLTTVENMKPVHCPCWNFAGLEQNFDFADIFACCAPRPLVFELGQKEKAPGGFPVAIGRAAFSEVQAAYGVWGAADRVALDVHPGGHVYFGARGLDVLMASLGPAQPWAWDDRPPPGRDPAAAENQEARRRGEIARRCFCRTLGVLEGWWATRDKQTNLFPRTLQQRVWAPQDNAADMLPFLFLTAHYLAPDYTPQLIDVLETERKLTSRLGPLPDWYVIGEGRFLHEQPDVPRIIFNAAEYCKDGLVPMTEVMGRGPWVEREIELMDAIFAQAPVASDFGPLPADDCEVNGDILQALARLYALTREPKYLEWAERIGDAYCLEVLPKNGGLPPHRWDFQRHQVVADQLNLNDHGNELIGGLAELYSIALTFHPDKAAQYREPLGAMFHRLLALARNEDGLWFNLVRASTGEPLDRATPDTWGYALAATYNFARATDDAELLAAVERVLHNIDQPRYRQWDGADSYADSIEGALVLLNRLPTAEGFRWLEKTLPVFLGKQRDDGIVEGWYGDGNYARTALMAGLYYTLGASGHPWRQDLRLGAVRAAQGVRLALEADADWQGCVRFDTPRHRTYLQLPVNYPRLNEFPEWFAVEEEGQYRVRIGSGPESIVLGRDLAQGLPVHVTASEPLVVVVEPCGAGDSP